MKVIFGPLVSAASGKIAGVVASKNAGGEYFRQRAIPLNPQSPNQLFARNIVTSYSRTWDTLTKQQRARWNAFGTAFGETDRLGKKVKISGLAALVRTNAPLTQAALTPVLDAPANMNIAMPEIAAVTVDYTVATKQLEINGITGTALATVFYIRLTPSVRAGVNFVKNLFRFWNTDAITAGPSMTQVDRFDPEYALTSTGYCQIQFLNPANGALSLPQQYDVTMV